MKKRRGWDRGLKLRPRVGGWSGTPVRCCCTARPIGLGSSQGCAGRSRATIVHIPARLTSHARTRVLKIEQSWSWAQAVIEDGERLSAIRAPAEPPNQGMTTAEASRLSALRSTEFVRDRA